jgi:hypothetical protein
LDEGCEITTQWEGLFSEDELRRESSFGRLQTQGGQAMVAHAANVLGLIEALIKIPDEAAAKLHGAGRAATGFILVLATQIYSESQYDAPLSRQRKWWKDVSDLRKVMLESLTKVFGYEGAATSILTAIEVIYRRYIRKAFTKDEDGLPSLASAPLKKLLKAHTQILVASGPNLFQRLLPKRSVEVKEKVETKKGKHVIETKTKKILIRPQIPKGPMTAWEENLAGRVYTVLGELETKAHLDLKFHKTR